MPLHLPFGPKQPWWRPAFSWPWCAPRQCVACHAWPADDVLCADCRHRHPRPAVRCTGCALALPGITQPGQYCGACLQHPPLWRSAGAWADYTYPWAPLIGRWKFAQQPGLAPAFARWLAHDAGLASLVQQADWLVPIPLSAARLRSRGYNPAAQLVQALAHTLAPRRHALHLLQRVRDTPAQSGLDRRARLRNLHGAMAVAPRAVAQLAGSHVLLVDDVMTTGATLHTATQTVLQAGAASVSVLCVARTP